MILIAKKICLYPNQNSDPTPSPDATVDIDDSRPEIRPSFFGAQNLTNLGQTCFLSSVLRMVYHIPALRALLVGNVDLSYSAVTGRSLSEFASRQMKKDELPPLLDHCRLFIEAVSDLFEGMDVATSKVDGKYVQKILVGLTPLVCMLGSLN